MDTQILQREKATFTLNPKTKEALFVNIPSTKRSRFVDSAIQKALAEEARLESLLLLRDIKRIPCSGKSSEDILHELRTS